MAAGYFGIGIENSKNWANVGTLWRSVYALEGRLMFTIGEPYKGQASDNVRAWHHVPLHHYETRDDFLKSGIPLGCQLIGIEIDERAVDLRKFKHPDNAVYVLGAEQEGLSPELAEACLAHGGLIRLPGRYSFNVAVAGSIVLCHRAMQRQREAALSSRRIEAHA